MPNFVVGEAIKVEKTGMITITLNVGWIRGHYTNFFICKIRPEMQGKNFPLVRGLDDAKKGGGG